MAANKTGDKLPMQAPIVQLINTEILVVYANLRFSDHNRPTIRIQNPENDPINAPTVVSRIIIFEI